MTELNDTLLSVILILGSIVLLVLIFVLMKVANSLQSMQEEVADLTKQIKPLIEKVTNVSAQAEELLSDLNEQKNILETSVMRVRDMTDSVYRTFNSLYSEVAPTVDSITVFLANVRRGINTFVSTWKGR